MDAQKNSFHNDLMGKELGIVLRNAREARGLKLREIGAHVGVSAAAVGQWERGDNDPSFGNLRKAAEILGIDTDAASRGILKDASAASGDVAPPRQGFEPTIIPGSELVGARDFPVFAAAEGGAGHLIVTIDPIDYVKRPHGLDHVRDGYAILVTGESMVPAYEPGDMAIVNSRLAPRHNKDAILYHTPPTGDAEALIKRIIGWDEKEWRLKQFNPAREFDADRFDWPICHAVVGNYRGR